ncbi:MAG TPA: FAD-dependent oxidoreductase [Candidatus Sulfotelmatobacter sp.]|nr:FAD-dependent oxidoreductase [Candidatus Sulfotelmatobacter sp.]
MKTYDFAIVGAGVFGAWTARFLRRSGASVILLDAYGPASSRASSGGETRVIRMGYGPDELYTRWAMRSLPLWREFSAQAGKKVFHQTGVLWLSNEADPYLQSLHEVLGKAGVARESLTADDIRRRWPQLQFADVTWGILEPESGVLMARSSVQALVAQLINAGVDYYPARVQPPETNGRLAEIKTSTGKSISAGTFVFTCGPWLPKVFPGLLEDRIFPTRQEVFFLGPPPGSVEFKPPRMPVWLHRTHADLPYALPDIENRGFKIAFDRHGEVFDPDAGSRLVPPASIERLRIYLKQYVPSLENAPLVETRVCQYENTSNGDFLIDHHPESNNVWIAGGGSGHGFKHGPALGEYLAERILHDAPAEPRLALAAKHTAQRREIY